MKQETGAAAALARWAEMERVESEEVARADAVLRRLLLLDRADDEIKGQISNAQRNLDSAKEQWAKTSKLLLSFDKGVAVERREGEKIPQSEAAEIVNTIVVRLRLANEQHILNLAREKQRCRTDQDFHRLNAESLRGCFTSAIQSAVNEKALPEWASTAAEGGL